MTRSRSSRRNFLASMMSARAVAASAPAAPEPKPVYRELGRTGLKVSSLGFGCMLASDPVVIERAADMGINYFDTARSYQGGNNERMVGSALKGKRQKLVVASKTPAKTKADALRDLDTTLSQLGTDYIDIWHLHSRSTPEEVTDDLLEAQESARKAGKIRFRGVSFHFNMKDMLPHLVKRGQTDVVLMTYNFTLAPDVGEAIRAARQAGMGVIAMKVMAGGYNRIRRGDRLYGQAPDALLNKLQKEGAMAAALKWVLKNESVGTAIIGITDFDQLDENFKAMSEPFRDRDATLLAQQLELIRPIYCRMCGSCSGVCDKGVPVNDVLRYLTYADGYGQFAMAREQFLSLPESAREVRCTNCAGCKIECPNGVAVRDRLIRAQEWFA